MEIIRTTLELQTLLDEHRREGHTIGLVPTMGALHAGHCSLVERARRECDVVVVSDFVNPTQFNNPQDLATYPRTEDADAELLRSHGVDCLFMPSVEEMYADGSDKRTFDLGPVAEVMEGAMRPGHFNGVAQVVSRLFHLVMPHKAYFGEKDFQQIAVIRRMTQLEGLADRLEIIPCPIVREADGLALSSRNVRLQPQERAFAPAIHAALQASLTGFRTGQPLEYLRSWVVDNLNETPHLRVEYFEIVNGRTMQPIREWRDTGDDIPVGCITVYCGDVRLIDNIKYTK